MSIKTIGVVGAGAMGTGIAHVAAMADYNVILRDVDMSYVDNSIQNMDKFMARSVEKGKMTEEQRRVALERIRKTVVLEDCADADFVIEAVIENIDLKKEIFQALDKICRPEVIFATNTSSMSITAIAAGTGRPDKVCGLHFFNPAQIMRLVEVIRGLETSDETISAAKTLAESFGKKTIEVKKDSPGFVVNRIMIPQFIEAARLLQEGVASVEDIDTAVKLGLNYPMGPFELMDFTGVDISYFVMEYFADELRNNQYAAPQIIKQMVRANKLGKKTGCGFYAKK
ncbi:3-hydroxyacyl-CoA dehydrogenase family protein [Desulfococcus multivorans]|jgi:3-hydroxybutyryl-CoA dehydrogenase|uniref:3-hydroxyacyl-CoA dehydrogenase NAD-binding protein n=1 Tax=Desulfococcus multivorans DSM 2059 TaxID=1121405 RepID=S7U694_DESML|nr:3-hydroxyacyl-CoA dehydrogenase family protein [Desulfococcus multivorans]AOY59245.1 Hbd5: 3-hydroxybutyryl-CoA dehydrogenase [Desulfococcus multivorans]AQV01467.1 3-hydroxybutyryl-CoA dehydrogenase [Desulfococcus multivorans]EPR45051.1 3-hydroxyacyl-CoA dehydrogenase NAD-binding protein [Desulfococcus multivorans DSM 2059]MDX9819819.1 3-hydroxyacyl-CoA dehydrogenase family protein [Desulfococcus multivorans]SKA29510.1 3-hydroxybutyryl-CoA dehydrogenase [Desulfococcus multivorans DSM 2059]